MVTCWGLPKPRLWPGRYLSLEFVNLPCNTTNTVLQVLAMAMNPECNRVEKMSSEEMIMSVNQRVDVKIKYEHKANMKSQVVV